MKYTVYFSLRTSAGNSTLFACFDLHCILLNAVEVLLVLVCLSAGYVIVSIATFLLKLKTFISCDLCVFSLQNLSLSLQQSIM